MPLHKSKSFLYNKTNSICFSAFYLFFSPNFGDLLWGFRIPFNKNIILPDLCLRHDCSLLQFERFQTEKMKGVKGK